MSEAHFVSLTEWLPASRCNREKRIRMTVLQGCQSGVWYQCKGNSISMARAVLRKGLCRIMYVVSMRISGVWLTVWMVRVSGVWLIVSS